MNNQINKNSLTTKNHPIEIPPSFFFKLYKDMWNAKKCDFYSLASWTSDPGRSFANSFDALFNNSSNLSSPFLCSTVWMKESAFTGKSIVQESGKGGEKKKYKIQQRNTIENTIPLE